MSPKHLISVVLMVNLGLLASTGLDPSRLLSQYQHTQWTTDDGLPQSSVIDIQQTDDGYLWFGTQEGLVQFDGLHFRIFDTRTNPNLKNHFINDLFLSREGRLWIASRSGVYWMSNHDFVAIPEFEQWKDARAFAFEQSDDGSIWIATNQGVARWKNNQLSTFTTSDGLPDNAVRALAFDGQRLWIGTRNGVVSWTENEGLRLERDLQFPVWSLLLDHQQRLWIGSRNSVFTKKDGILREISIFPDKLGDNLVLALTEDRPGQIWIGSSLGLCRWIEGEIEYPPSQSLLDRVVIRSLYSDREDHLWIGGGWSGLHKLSNSPILCFSVDEGLLESNTWAMAESPAGTMWVGMDSGISEIRDGEVRSNWGNEEGFPAKFIRSMFAHEDGTVWMGTRNDGIYLFKQDKTWMHIDDELGLPNNNIRAFAQLSDGGVLVGSFGAGLAWVSDLGDQVEPWGPDISNQFIMSLAIDHDSQVWVGTDGDGVYRIRDGELTHFGAKQGVTNPRVLQIAINDDNTIWAGTEGGGIFYFDGHQFHNLNVSLGLFDNIAFSLLKDDEQSLWVSCNRGLYRLFEPTAIESALGQFQLPPNQIYGRAEGMRSVECNFGGTNSGVRAADGALWFPTSKGVAIVDTKRLSQAAEMPLSPSITAARANGVIFIEGQTLESGVERLEVSFTAPTMDHPERVLFSYLLEGYDRKWSEADTSRQATYTKIPPGSYDFRLRVSRDGKRWNEIPIAFDFLVKAKIHQTWWFFALVFLAIAFSVFHALRLRTAQIRLRETELKYLVAVRTKELEETNHQLVETQNQLIETAHSAGMAEVATQVLHNVGNAMNSINVSGQILKKQTSSLQTDFVARILKLLKGHADQLHTFLNDPKGQKALNGLKKFIESLKSTQTAMNQEVDELSHRINHVNEIIHAQQITAAGGRLFERVSVSELISQALKIQESALQYHLISMRRVELMLAPVELEKAKFLQVLVNIIKNACESFDHHDTKKSRHLDISLGQASDLDGQPHAVVVISDNGIGIDQQEMNMIFSHGFTTKETGHGFGLHFCANAMADLNGDISVYSRGQHLGTAFTLIVPQN